MNGLSRLSRSWRSGDPGWTLAAHPATGRWAGPQGAGAGAVTGTGNCREELAGLPGRLASVPAAGWLFLLQVIAAFGLAAAVFVTGSRLAVASGAGFALPRSGAGRPGRRPGRARPASSPRPAGSTGCQFSATARYGWEGGIGTVWWNLPSRDLTVVVLTQRGRRRNRDAWRVTTCCPPPSPLANPVRWPDAAAARCPGCEERRRRCASSMAMLSIISAASTNSDSVPTHYPQLPTSPRSPGSPTAREAM